MKTRDYHARPVDATTPGRGSSAVTPSDSGAGWPDGELSRALYVTTAGDVSFVGADGATCVWTVPANFIIPVAMSRVNATGTTGGAGATGLRAIW